MSITLESESCTDKRAVIEAVCNTCITTSLSLVRLGFGQKHRAERTSRFVIQKMKKIKLGSSHRCLNFSTYCAASKCHRMCSIPSVLDGSVI
mmetsp:Transcript_31642/g.53525  ORF Transcript_31642/g.53525 Transcript_31642/m.53525 type:complete len:92 (+) Transcript_31642:25-300(+)